MNWMEEFIGQCLAEVPEGGYRTRTEKELEDHLLSLCRSLEQAGYPPEEARVLAASRMGDPAELARRYAREWRRRTLWPRWLAAAELTPTLLGCAVLLWGGRLARALEADPFGGETVALAEGLSRRCGQVTAASVLVCAAGNLGQMLLFSVLRDMRFLVSFPVTTVLLAVSLDLLCRYLRRAKAVSDDSESII